MDKLSIADIKIAARGHERSLCLASGIPSTVIDKRKHQPCSCGGKDRLRITSDFQFFCGGGGALETGDFIDLICHYTGQTVSGALVLIKDYLGLSRINDRQRNNLLKIKNKEFNNARLQSLITKENTFEDFEIVNSMTDLELMIKERGVKRLTTLDEADYANDVAWEILSRYDRSKIIEKQQYLKKHWRT